MKLSQQITTPHCCSNPGWRLLRVSTHALASALYSGDVTAALLRCEHCGALADLLMYGDVVATLEPFLDGPRTAHYAIVVKGDIEPEIHGPFTCAKARDAFVRRYRGKDTDAVDGLYWMDIKERAYGKSGNHKPNIGAYSGGFFSE